MKLRDLFKLDILAGDTIVVKYFRHYIGGSKMSVLAVLDDEHGIEDVSDDVLDGYCVQAVTAVGYGEINVIVWRDRD